MSQIDGYSHAIEMNIFPKKAASSTIAREKHVFFYFSKDIEITFWKKILLSSDQSVSLFLTFGYETT